MEGWRLYYDDDTTFDWDGEPPPNLKRTGVQVVMQFDKMTGAKLLTSSEGYWYWSDGVWYPSELMGFWDYLFTHSLPLYVIFGRWCPEDKYQAIYRKAIKDRDKFAEKRYERPLRPL